MAVVAQIVTKLKLDSKKFSKDTKDATKNILKMAVAATAIKAAFTALAFTTANYQDETIKAARAAGSTAEEFSGLQFAANLASVSQDSLVKSLSKLASPTAEMNKELVKLNVSLIDSAGNTRSQGEVIIDLADAFKDMDSPMQKSASAMKLFGQRGVEMVNFLKDGGDAIKDLQEEAKLLGLVFSEEAGENAELFNDNLAKLKSSIQGVGFAIGESIIEFTNQNGIITALTDVIKDIIKFWKELDGDVKSAIITFVSIATTIGMVAGAIVAMIALKPLIVSFFTTLSANPVILALTALAILVVAVAVSIRKNWSQMKNIIDPLSDSFSSFATIIEGMIKPLRDMFGDMINAAKATEKIGQNMKDATTEVNIFGTVAKAIFSTVAGAIVLFLTGLNTIILTVDLIIDTFTNLGKIIVAVLTLNVKKIKNLFEQIQVSGKLTFLEIQKAGLEAADAIGQIFKKPIVLLIDVDKFKKGLGDAGKEQKKIIKVTAAWQTELERLTGAFNKTTDSLKRLKTDAQKVIEGANIASFFADQANQLVGIANDIGDIIVAGLQRTQELMNREFEIQAAVLAKTQETQRKILEDSQEEELTTLKDSFDESIKALEDAEADRLLVIETGAANRLLVLDEEFQALKIIEEEKFAFFLEQEAIKFEAEKEIILSKAADEEQRKISEQILIEDFNGFVENETARHDKLLSDMQKEFLKKERDADTTAKQDAIDITSETNTEITNLETDRATALTDIQTKFNEESTELQTNQNDVTEKLEKDRLRANWKAQVAQFEATKTLKKVTIAAEAAAAAAIVVATQAALIPVGGMAIGAAIATVILGIAATRISQVNKEKPIKPAGLFREGGVVSGPSHEGGGVPAMLEGGEAVIDKIRTAKFFDAIDGINSGQKSIVINFESGAIMITGIDENRFTEDFMDELGEAMASRMEREGFLQ